MAQWSAGALRAASFPAADLADETLPGGTGLPLAPPLGISLQTEPVE